MTDYAVKLDAAIAWLGSRYVFHPDRAVQRIPFAEQIPMHRADVTQTWERARKRMNPVNLIVTGESK